MYMCISNLCIYVYIYMCVCVCVCVCLLDDTHSCKNEI